MSKKRVAKILSICLFIALMVGGLSIVDYIRETRDYTKTLTTQKARKVQKEIIEAQNPSPIKMERQIQQDKSSENDISEKNSINILFLGIDRTRERDETLKVFRPDTIALVSINLYTKKLQVLSIPRDTYAYIPCVKKMDKINHSYPFGGMGERGTESTIAAVNRFIKYSSVDYYFTLDMEPIPEIVDELGGVELDVEIDMKTHGANLSKGKQLLNGKGAFDYIHWRYSGNGDIDRIKRQQKFFKAMFSKLKDSKNIGNAVKLLLGYNEYIKTDLSTKQLMSLAVLANDMPKGNASFYTIPGNPQYMSKISYWVPSEPETDSLLKQIFEVKTNTYKSAFNQN